MVFDQLLLQHKSHFSVEIFCLQEKSWYKCCCLWSEEALEYQHVALSIKHILLSSSANVSRGCVKALN